ncbi:hypothetical protein [Deinococcus sedimenti]|uniref:hypothetical protein n=1 Tax=Deinococcus sedimenti TaxID=1867090 RepID=UPI0016658AB1|nr:hypothetical protein [Deinococcus sedimenti]
MRHLLHLIGREECEEAVLTLYSQIQKGEQSEAGAFEALRSLTRFDVHAVALHALLTGRRKVHDNGRIRAGGGSQAVSARY